MIKLKGIRTNTKVGQTFNIGYKMTTSHIDFTITTDNTKKPGENWREKIEIEMDQSEVLPGMADGTISTKMAAAGKVDSSGNVNELLGEFNLAAQGSDMVGVEVNINLENTRGSILLTQKIMAGAGYDRIQMLGQWKANVKQFSFLAKRDSITMVTAKLFVLQNGVRVTVKSTDQKMTGVIPKSLNTKLTYAMSQNEFELKFDHLHKMRNKPIHGQLALTVGTEKFGATFDWNKV